MAFAEKFEELKVWQEARMLVKATYLIFKPCKDYAFRDQIQRAAISFMNNISEGFERKTKIDFAHFLDLAKASSGEVRSMLYAAEDLQYISSSDAIALREHSSQLSRSIGSLASKLRQQFNSSK